MVLTKAKYNNDFINKNNNNNNKSNSNNNRGECIAPTNPTTYIAVEKKS